MTTKDILKELRRERSLSAQQVADGCEMSLGVYKKYESGERGVGTPALIKLADFYGVTTDYLLGRTETKPDPVEMLTRIEDEQKLVKAYFSLPPQLRANFLQSLSDALREQEETNITVTQNSAQAIARSRDGDFKPVPDDEQFKGFTIPTDDEIDG